MAGLQLYRLLSGVRFTGTHVLPGVDVGGKGRLSGTAAKLSRTPPRGPTSRKIPPLVPVLVPGFFPAAIFFLSQTAGYTGARNPVIARLFGLGYAQRS